MALLRSSPRSRAGFTLIELLVVIAIIAILVSLLGAGIFYAYTSAQNAGARAEMTQLHTAVQAFKTKYGIYPPDRFRLYSSAAEYAADINGGYAWSNPTLAMNSRNVISRMWPNIGNFSNIPWADGVAGHAFNVQNANNPYANVKYVDLEGDQCLVFFLSGIPSASNIAGTPGMPMGFSTNPKDPATVDPNDVTKQKRTKVFYDFNISRFIARPNQAGPIPPAWPNQSFPTLVNSNNTAPTNLPIIFYSYADYFGNGEPYIYFCAANSRKNGYDQFMKFDASGNFVPPPSTQFIQLPPTDNLNANMVVYPYFQPLLPSQPVPSQPPTPPPVQNFQNPDTFQIISAGRDGKFNAIPPNMAYLPSNYGNWKAYIPALYQSPFQWSATNVTFIMSNPGAQDDITNFYDNKMGISQ